MDTRKIKKLIELVKETDIGELEVTSENETVRIRAKGSRAVAAPIQPTIAAPIAETPSINALHTPTPDKTTAPKKAATPEGHSVKSPMVGTIYLASKPGDPPFVAVGDRVQVGDTLCLIEAMKMFNKIEVDKSGVISARLIDNEQPVEYNQPLFIIEAGE